MKRLALAALCLVACGHVETYDAPLRAPRAPRAGRVELYMQGQAVPARPYVELAIVQAVGFGSDATPEDVVKGLLDRAASLGCDAVVRVAIDLGYSRANGAGVCVAYTGDGPPAPPPVLPAPRSDVPTSPPPLAPRPEPLPSTGQGQGSGR